MVQKKDDPAATSPGPRRRGRPRSYDPDTALARATAAFWRRGYAGTSLDEVSGATGMNRPSLYAAFGDKRALYLQALDAYWEQAYAGMRDALGGDRSLAEAMMEVYRRALAIYIPGKGRPRGCFAIGTATTEAMEDRRVRAAFAKGLCALDALFEARIRAARERGELGADADPAALAALASATLYFLAIRARAGGRRADLEQMARKAVSVICGDRTPPGC